METGRRTFLRILGSTLALLLGRPALAREATRASEVHQATRNTPRGALGVRLPKLRAAPTSFNSYPGAARKKLPPAVEEGALPLAEVVGSYAVARGFGGDPLSLAELARLLFFTNGVTARRGRRALRAAPSAGALYSAGIVLGPAMGALLMSISTVVVALNARRLRLES